MQVKCSLIKKDPSSLFFKIGMANLLLEYLNHLISMITVTFPDFSISFKEGTIMKLSLLIYPSLFRVTSTDNPDQQPLHSHVKPPIVDITSSFSAVLIMQVLEANKVRRYKLKLPRVIKYRKASSFKKFPSNSSVFNCFHWPLAKILHPSSVIKLWLRNICCIWGIFIVMRPVKP